MDHPGAARVRQQVAGETRNRIYPAGAVVGLLILSSGGFMVGMDVGLSPGWLVVALGIAFGAGVASSGLGPTVGSLWLVGLWWFVFPPLVGLLGGDWGPASRFSHPRMQGFAYGTARAELIGGIEYGVKYGLLFALVGGTIGYRSGAVTRRVADRTGERR